MRLIFVSAFCICGVWVTPDVTKTTVLLELVAAYDGALKETDGGTDVATLPANSLNDRHPLIWCDHSSGVRLVAGTCSTYSRTAGASSPSADFWRSWASFSTRLAFAGASDRRPSNSFFWLSSSGISRDHPPLRCYRHTLPILNCTSLISSASPPVNRRMVSHSTHPPSQSSLPAGSEGRDSVWAEFPRG